jgi:hypothetical protein
MYNQSVTCVFVLILSAIDDIKDQDFGAAVLESQKQRAVNNKYLRMLT